MAWPSPSIWPTRCCKPTACRFDELKLVAGRGLLGALAYFGLDSDTGGFFHALAHDCDIVFQAVEGGLDQDRVMDGGTDLDAAFDPQTTMPLRFRYCSKRFSRKLCPSKTW